MKAIIFLVTALANIGIGVVLFFFLILALNGVTGNQAELGLYLFIGWVVVASIIAGVLGILSANYLAAKTSFNQWLAPLLVIVVFIFLGTAANIVGVIAAIGLTMARL